MLEVSHHIRASYLTALASLKVGAISIPVHDEQLPAGVSPASINGGLAYVLILDQTETPTDFNKCGYIQSCSITLDVVTKFAKGSGGKLTSELISNEIQKIVLPFASNGLTINSQFKIISVSKELSQGLVENTDTETAYRKIIIYTNKINEK